MRKSLKYLAVAIVMLLTLSACQTDATVASQNLSLAAEQFEIDRRIVFFNGITDTYLLEIIGKCSITADTADIQLEVTCKTGPDEFKKHFLGLSDNVSYFVEQLEGFDVDVFHYRVIFKPEVILPNIDLVTS